MRPRAAWISAPLLAGVLALAPRAAEATSCLPTIDALAPADGEVLPVDARPLASSSCGVDLSGWQVTVDGEPGALFVQSPDFGYGMLSSIGIAPAPSEGAVVELVGCSQGCWDGADEDIVRSYVVGASDRDAPEAPVLLDLTHTDEIITQLDWATGEEIPLAVRRWSLSFEPPVLDEPVAWEIEVGPRTTSHPSRTARIMEDTDDLVVLTRTESDAGLEVCAVARAVDLAGNASAVRELCVEVGEGELLPEVPGGEVEDDGAGDGGEDDGADGDDGTEEIPEDEDEGAALDDVGGGCSIGGPGGSGWRASALLGLLLVGLRRRW